jgi:thiol-disulfide isomerase/thioredoxin
MIITHMLLPKIARFLLPAMLLFGYTRCSLQPLPVLSGKIMLSDGWKPVVYLIKPRNFAEIASNYNGIVVDSAAIDSDGRFSFERWPDKETKGLFEVCVQPRASRFANQLLDDDPTAANYMPIVLAKDLSVQVSATADRFQASFSIRQPSGENDGLLKIRDIRHAAYRQQQDVLRTAPDENTLLEHEDALLRFREPLMAFADTCSWFWPALTAIRWVSPAADYERVPEFLGRQCKKWGTQAHNGNWSNQLCEAANPAKLPVQTGILIPDFAMPMASGDTIMLYALLGKRLTIVDVWASWCAPCRRENRAILAPLYRSWKEKGLQIIGYSIDSSRSTWEAAIAKDGAGWPHAAHLSGDATPFMETLHLTSIPANFILDSTGKILAKNLHGEALSAFVEAYLK